MELAEKTTYKRGATDFSSQVARMKAADCDMVVLGTIIRETIGTIGEARKTGFSPTFLGSRAAYTDLIHKLGGKAMDGLYATHDGAATRTSTMRRSRSASGPTSTRPSSTRTRPCSRSTATASSTSFVRAAAARPAPNLTTDSFIKAMDTMTFPPDMFGSAEVTFTAEEAAGQRPVAPVADPGRQWKVVSDYATP